MPKPPGDEEVTVPEAAKLLGLQPQTVYVLIDSGALYAEVDRPADGPERRRVTRLRRTEVDAFIERARIKPGDLAGLYPPAQGRNR